MKMQSHRDFLIAVSLFLAFNLLGQPAFGQDEKPNNAKGKTGTPLFEPNAKANHVISPLDENGDVDYVAAINDLFSKGVTPENNALVKFVEAIGPTPRGESVPKEFFERLGIARPSKNKKQLVRYDDWCKANDIKEPNKDKNTERYGQPLIKLQKWFAASYAWNAVECPEVARWVQDNEPGWAIIQEGLKQKKFYYPTVSDLPDWPPLLNWNQDYMDSLSEVQFGLSIRCGMHLGAGNLNLAMEEALQAFRLAELVSNSSNMNSSLFAGRILGSANRMAILIAMNENATAAQLREFLKQIEPIVHSTNMKRTLDQGERFAALEAAQIAGRDGIMPSKKSARGGEINRSEVVRKSDPEMAMVVVNSKYNELVESIDETSMAKTLKNLDTFSKNMSAFKRATSNKSQVSLLLGGKKAKGRQAGGILAGMLMPATGVVYAAEIRQESCLRMLKLRLALEIHKKEQGTYPESLAELSPSILIKIPNAPSREATFTYRIEDESVRLYSLGVDGVDQNGKGVLTDDYPEGDDLEFLPRKQITWAEFLKVKEEERLEYRRR